MLQFLCQYPYKNIRGPNVFFYFGHFRGTKIKKLIEKVKALLQIKINCRKPDFKSHICIIHVQLYQKNKNSW